MTYRVKVDIRQLPPDLHDVEFRLHFTIVDEDNNALVSGKTEFSAPVSDAVILDALSSAIAQEPFTGALQLSPTVEIRDEDLDNKSFDLPLVVITT